jgi:hypothetical protein
MTFEEKAEEAATILAERGCERVADEPGWCWESALNRVRFSAPTAAHSTFPYFVSRERKELGPNGKATLSPRQPPAALGADETPERIADIVENALSDPF